VVLERFEGLGGGFIIQANDGNCAVVLGGAGKVHVGDIGIESAEGCTDEADGSRFIEVLNDEIGPFEFRFQAVIIQSNQACSSPGSTVPAAEDSPFFPFTLTVIRPV